MLLETEILHDMMKHLNPLNVTRNTLYKYDMRFYEITFFLKFSRYIVIPEKIAIFLHVFHYKKYYELNSKQKIALIIILTIKYLNSD